MGGGFPLVQTSLKHKIWPNSNSMIVLEMGHKLKDWIFDIFVSIIGRMCSIADLW